MSEGRKRGEHEPQLILALIELYTEIKKIYQSQNGSGLKNYDKKGKETSI
jgi:hypothetical protein